jgi:hypothetical protein
VLRRLRWFSHALFGCSVLVWTSISSCVSDGEGDLCPAITAKDDELQVANCPRGIISLSGVVYDSSGAKTSYAFMVTCKDRAAHGIWSRARGVECTEGSYPCDGGVCTPRSDLDCRIMTNCVELGECGYVDGKCVLTDEGCSTSKIPCGLSGACHLGDGVCVATSDADCREPFGKCPDCEFKGPCVFSGSCHVKDGACVAIDDGDCDKAQQCAFAGKCTLEGETCIAGSDSDCAASEVCRTAGQCSAVAGSCAVK